MKPCKVNDNKRHKWAFSHNRIIRSVGLQTARLSKRGVYSCACGESKLGAPSHE